MTTPILMLILLTAPYLVVLALNRFAGKVFNLRSAAVIGLGLLFVLTGIGHFTQAGPMTQMLPAWVPERLLLVHVTGVLEFAIALGFFIPRFRHAAGLAAIVVLILFFPANVYAAFNHVAMGGHAWGPAYLLIRAPLQIIILLWTYWFIVRTARPQQLHFSS